jgi:diaminopropionate ammonia-lyase
MLDARSGAAVAEVIDAIFAAPPTPLRPLAGMARAHGLGAIHLKDEGGRLGLRSFKALGGAYAVIQLVREEAATRLGRPVAIGALPRAGQCALDAASPAMHGDPEVRQIASALTFACATDGNHGQSVAAGARLMGARAVIFVHEGVSAERRQSIARFGAHLCVVPGTYDDAVAESARQSLQNGWTLLSDTSWAGYTEVPRLVMQGYTLMTHELLVQLQDAPTHLFLQAGVGGFAAAVAAALPDCFAPAAPRIVIVEPSRAACLMASARAGHCVKIAAGLPTVMSMLECHEPSEFAWSLLSPRASAFMTVEDASALAAMRVLAHPDDPAETVVAGESGAAGLAGLLAACEDPDIRRALDLNAESRVLLFNTEGATDEERYLAAVGETPAEVTARGAIARAAAVR